MKWTTYSEIAGRHLGATDAIVHQVVVLLGLRSSTKHFRKVGDASELSPAGTALVERELLSRGHRSLYETRTLER